MFNFGIFRGSFRHFYTFTGFPRHFMCIIQIWNTCTFSSAYKLVEKSNMCPWLHANVPWKKWEWISHTLPPSLGRKHWDTWFLNSSKSKTRFKFMNLAWYHGATSTCLGKKIVPFGAGLGISFSQTRDSRNKHDGFGRERATFGDETISAASYCFQKISSVNIEQQECCV